MDPLFAGQGADTARHGSFSNPTGPPPPYESVITDAASHSLPGPGANTAAAGAAGGPLTDAAGGADFFGAYPAAPPSLQQQQQQPAGAVSNGSSHHQLGGGGSSSSSPFSEILVSDPVKQGEGVSAYVSYKVRSRTSLPQYNRPTSEVIRRFRDFCHLEALLASKHRGAIVPPLPEKNAVQKFQMAGGFIEERRRALQVFLNRLAAHPVFASSPELQLFLEATEDTWAVEMARAQSSGIGAAPQLSSSSSFNSSNEAAGPKKRLGEAVGWIKGLGAAATTMVGSAAGGGARAADAAEDPEYIKVRDYLIALEAHLSEAHRQAARLTAKEVEVGEAVLEFGQSLERLGRMEEGNVSEAFSQLSSRAAELVVARRRGCEALGAKFEGPLKEAVRGVRSVMAVCSDRSAALSAHLAAKHDVDSRKVKWAKLRGTPGSPPEKLADAEREVAEAEARLRDTKTAYEELVATMSGELGRWQAERSADMAGLLKQFALAQASMASEGVKAWSGLLGELQAVDGISSGSDAAAGVPAVPSAAAAAPAPPAMLV